MESVHRSDVEIARRDVAESKMEMRKTPNRYVLKVLHIISTLSRYQEVAHVLPFRCSFDHEPRPRSIRPPATVHHHRRHPNQAAHNCSGNLSLHLTLSCKSLTLCRKSQTGCNKRSGDNLRPVLWHIDHIPNAHHNCSNISRDWDLEARAAGPTYWRGCCNLDNPIRIANGNRIACSGVGIGVGDGVGILPKTLISIRSARLVRRLRVTSLSLMGRQTGTSAWSVHLPTYNSTCLSCPVGRYSLDAPCF